MCACMSIYIYEIERVALIYLDSSENDRHREASVYKRVVNET